MFTASLVIAARILLALVVRRMATYRRCPRPFLNGVLTGFFPVLGALVTVIRPRRGRAVDIDGNAVSGRQAERAYFRRILDRTVVRFFRRGVAGIAGLLLLPVTVPLAVLFPKVRPYRSREVSGQGRGVKLDLDNTEAGEERRSIRRRDREEQHGRVVRMQTPGEIASEIASFNEGRVISIPQEDTAGMESPVFSGHPAPEPASEPIPIPVPEDEPGMTDNVSVERLEGVFVPDADGRGEGTHVFFVAAAQQLEVSRLLRDSGLKYRLEIPSSRGDYEGRAYSYNATGDRFNILEESCRIRPVTVELDRGRHTARLVESYVAPNFVDGVLKEAGYIERDMERDLGLRSQRRRGYAFDDAYTVHHDDRKVYLEKDGNVIATLSYDSDSFSRVSVHDEGACALLGITSTMNAQAFLMKARDIVLDEGNILAARKDIEFDTVRSLRRETPAERLGRRFGNMFNNNLS